MSNTVSGSCLCNAVDYTIEGEIMTVVNCHCNTCKKNIGAAFSTIAVVMEKDLHINDPDRKLRSFAVSAKARKHFCGECGTPLLNLHSDFKGMAMVPIGSLDKPCQEPASVNFFCERMLPWVTQIGSLESFDRLRRG